MRLEENQGQAGWGSGSIHRLRIPTKAELFGLGVIPIIPVTLNYKGKSVTGRGGLDTGASSTYLIIDAGTAKKLGLPNYGDSPIRVLGGAKVGAYKSALDTLAVEGSSECTFKNPPTIVMEMNDPETFNVLIGEDYLRRIGATISYIHGPPTIMCGGSTLRWLDDPWSGVNPYLLVVGGLFLGGFLVSLVVDRN